VNSGTVAIENVSTELCPFQHLRREKLKEEGDGEYLPLFEKKK